MGKKSQGYIWLRKKVINKSTHEKKKWVGKRYAELPKLLGLAYNKENLARIRVNEKPLTWKNLLRRLRTEDRVEVLVNPEGKFMMGALLIIAGIIAMIIPGGQQAGISLLVAGVSSLVASLLIRKPKVKGASGSETKDARPEIRGATNEISKSIVPVLLGTTKITPYYGQYPFRRTGEGNAVNILEQYLIPTYKNTVISDERMGETRIQDFEGNVTVTKEYGSSTPITFSNIYPTGKDELLTIDEATYTNDIIVSASKHNGTLPISISINYTLLSSIGNFSNKVVRVSGVDSGAYVDITISSGELTDETTHYNYTSPAPFNLELSNEHIKFQNLNDTQQTADEINEDMRCTFVSFNSETHDSSFNRIKGQPSTVIDTTPEKSIALEWVFKFPQGLYKQEDSSKSGRAMYATCRFKEKDTTTYGDLNDATAIYVIKEDGTKVYLRYNGEVYSNPAETSTVYNPVTNNITFYSPATDDIIDELFFKNIGVELPENKYTYQVSSKGFVGGKNTYDVGSIQLADVYAIMEGEPLNIGVLEDLLQIKVSARAYRNLQGTLKQYNFIGTCVIPVWDSVGENWDTEEASTNPAANIRYLITSTLINPRADTADIIDNDSFVAFYNFCEAEGYTVSALITDPTKIYSIIKTILDNCQASLTDIEGRIGIAMDTEKEVTNMITPHNSWDLKTKYYIGKKTDALRASYTDNSDYTEQEIARYYYGGVVNEEPAAGLSSFDYELLKVDIEYTKDKAHVEKLLNYRLKSTQQRTREFTFKVNMEGLAFKIYDRILLSNTTNTGQQFSGRVKYVTRNGAGNITKIRLKSYVELDIPQNSTRFKMYIRSMKDLGSGEGEFTVTSFDVEEAGGRFIELTPVIAVDDDSVVNGEQEITYIDSVGWYDGDLFDINDATINDCVITDIKVKEDLTAEVIALETPQEFWD